MQSNTHAAVGMTVGLVASMAQPQDVTLLAVTAAFVGSIICDIDVGETGKKQTSMIISVVSGVAMIVLVIYSYIFNNGLPRTIIGAAIFLGLCIYGSRKPHRTFMHSLLGMMLLSGCVYLIIPAASVYFLLGYVSHLILDIINYRPVMLLYPWKKGYALKLCYSKSKASNVLLWVAIAIFLSLTLLLFAY
jgi:inner membrane protein